jgi:uncharacterized membrane protein YedE/YeeE
VRGSLSFAAGLIFGVGLLVAGMADPNKVRAFLDVAGAWDPSLAFVMVSAIGVHLAAFRFISKLKRPLMAERFRIPQKTAVDGRLLAGAAIFGAGWGLSGICPGPAVVSLGAGVVPAAAFSAAAVIGVLLFRAFDTRDQTP